MLFFSSLTAILDGATGLVTSIVVCLIGLSGTIIVGLPETVDMGANYNVYISLLVDFSKDTIALESIVLFYGLLQLVVIVGTAASAVLTLIVASLREGSGVFRQFWISIAGILLFFFLLKKLADSCSEYKKLSMSTFITFIVSSAC